MSDTEFDRKKIEKKIHDLAESMERMRVAHADKDDVVVDMRYATKTRLELLAEELLPVFSDVPPGNDQFEFALTNGDTPRLWIDMTSFVRMGRDQREYEFVKDTRLGRTILGQTKDRVKMGRQVTDYVSERILERERVLEGDWVSMQANRKIVSISNYAVLGMPVWAVAMWFLIGLFGGAFMLAVIAWFWPT